MFLYIWMYDYYWHAVSKHCRSYSSYGTVFWPPPPPPLAKLQHNYFIFLSNCLFLLHLCTKASPCDNVIPIGPFLLGIHPLIDWLWITSFFYCIWKDDLDELEVYGKEEQAGVKLTSYTFEVSLSIHCMTFTRPCEYSICQVTEYHS